MAVRVLSHQQLPIDSEDDIVLARRAIRLLAEKNGFDTFSAAALTTAASELGRNIWAHAGNGAVVMEEVEEDERVGVRARFEDHGPGIPDIPRVLAGGYSTRRTLGLGLFGTQRLVDEFHIDSQVGRGTSVTITKWKRF